MSLSGAHLVHAQPRARSREVKVDAAFEVGLERLRRGEAADAYVTGSLLAGLGNGRSDVDLFLVVEGDARPAEQVLRDGVRVDLEFRTFEQLCQLVDDIEATPSDLDDIQRAVSASRLDDAARLYYARPCLADGVVSELVGRLRALEGRLRQARLIRTSSIFASKIEDLHGALESRADRESLHISEHLLLEGLDAFLVGCGEYYLNAKWLYAKLARVAAADALCAVLDDLLYRISLARADEVARRRLRLAQQLIAAGMTLGWDEPAAFVWPHWASGDDAVFRSEAWSPLRFGETVWLEGIDSELHVEMSPAGLLLWGLLDGRARSEVIESACRVLPLVGVSVPSPQVESYLDQLVEIGVALTHQVP